MLKKTGLLLYCPSCNMPNAACRRSVPCRFTSLPRPNVATSVTARRCLPASSPFLHSPLIALCRCACCSRHGRAIVARCTIARFTLAVAWCAVAHSAVRVLHHKDVNLPARVVCPLNHKVANARHSCPCDPSCTKLCRNVFAWSVLYSVLLCRAPKWL